VISLLINYLFFTLFAFAPEAFLNAARQAAFTDHPSFKFNMALGNE
jgi:hypothetical protein